jgi:hypothetical protein
MSLWDKFCYYAGLAGLIGLPIVLVVDVLMVEPQIYHLKAVTGLIVFGFVFHQGKKARQAARE